MLVRRIATVTISAPEASMAARACAKSLYLPVPTSSREWKVRQAIRSGSFISAPAHGHDDLQPVAVGDRRRAVRASRHDLAIALHRDFLALQRHSLEEFGDRQGPLAMLCAAVHS